MRAHAFDCVGSKRVYTVQTDARFRGKLHMKRRERKKKKDSDNYIPTLPLHTSPGNPPSVPNLDVQKLATRKPVFIIEVMV